MNDPTYYDLPRPGIGSTVRRAMTAASDDLKRRGALAALVSALLFSLILSVAWLTAFQLLTVLVDYVALTAPAVLTAVLEVGVYVVTAVLLVTLLLPVWLGRLRMAGLVCTGRVPQVREVLYYYTSHRLLGRAALIGLVLLLQVLLPISLLAGGSVFLLWLYDEILFFAMATGPAILLMVLGFFVLLALFVGAILVSGVWTMFAAVAVGNEKMPVYRALALSLRVGRRHMGALTLFALRSLWHLLLSAVSFGVLYMYWYSHHYLLSYLRLSMALCSEKEN